MQRGYIRVRAADGSYPYEEFSIDSTETVYLTLSQLVDGVETVLDLSADTVSVRLRVQKQATAGTPPIDVEATKRAGTTLDGDTGKVSAVITPRAASFTDGDVVEVGAYVVNAGTVDTLTLSGYLETLWGGLWRAKIRGALDQ